MANFVEQATLRLVDQSSGPIRKVNAELKKLFTTVNKLQSKTIKLDVNAKGLNQATTATRKLNADLSKLAARRPRVNVNTTAAQQQINALKNAVNSLPKSRTIRLNTSGNPNVPQGAGGGNGSVQRANNLFASRRADNDWVAAGRIIARSFVASMGFTLAQLTRNATKTAGQGIMSLDDARALARVSGVDVGGLEASASRAAAGTKGVSIADIMAAAVEQQGQLQARLKAGTITQAEYNRQLDATTTQIAKSTQIYGTLQGDFKGGAEQARQVLKALDLTTSSNDPVKNLQKRQAMTDAIMKSQIAVGGDVDAADIKRKLQQLGPVAAQSLTPRGMQVLIHSMDEAGASAAANIRSSFRDLTRGDLNKKDKQRQIAAGLRDKNGKTVFTDEQLGDPLAMAADVIIPKLRAMGTNLDSTTAVMAALDDQLGFTTKGAQLFASIIPQIAQKEQELTRANTVDPNKILGDQSTLRANLAEINTAFQDAVGKVASSTQALDLMKGAAATTGEVLTSLSKGELPSGKDAIAAAGGLAALGITSAIAATLDPATAPLGTAALALDGSAAALTASAAALTGAAGVNAATGLATGAAAGGGILSTLLKRTGLGVLAAGSIALLNKAVQADAERERNGDKNTLLGAIRDVFKGARDNIATRDSIARSVQTQRDEQRTTRIESQVRRLENDTRIRASALMKPGQVPDQIANLKLQAQTIKVDAATAEMGRIMKLEQQDRSAADLVAARKLNANPALEDRATRATRTNDFAAMINSMDAAASTIQSAIGTGSAQGGATIQTDMIAGGASAAAAILGAGTGFGSTAAGIMAAAGAAFGDNAAARINAAAANIRLSIQQPGPSPNVGTVKPSNS
ncbi:hypothetical protein EJ069_10325 [Mesorhizobium sp. M2A.F.Ca.ET.043.05.1.1]|uniref:hypothetical protein n=1 Tax=Mesorhizobium sp. M2A.F.Ca.ET.043.05.1.1 TaxID=2493671 RepID=UPI000F75C489|nr:hypothetical protein [Mesorhizobium sp. M2A.F.Ca.ET.043.05.1.1]AZO15090.1 hypothetical protein EJ069_10325 [Mesorhizobium sp. M2A.F.Ca.ET.043.05.1.1]